MGMKFRSPGPLRFTFFGRSSALAWLILLACSHDDRLQAQAPYSTGPGRTSIFGYYDPSGPAPKAPSLPTPPYTMPPMPTVPLSDYLSYKSALSQYVQSSFSFPPRVDATPPPVIPRAPSAVSPVASGPTVSFEGIQDTGFQPPSPDIAVGPSDAIGVVNSTIAQYTKSGTLKKQTAFADWFASVFSRVCPSGSGQCLIFDPCIRYDQLHGRFLFLVSTRDFLQRQAFLLLSVSNGATYDSGWKTWVLDPRVNAGLITDSFSDFWRIGFDNVAVYLSGNLFQQGGGFLYGKIRVLKKSELYDPATTTLNFNDIWNLKNDDATSTSPATTASSLAPAVIRGKPAAITAPLFVNASDRAPATFLTVWKIDNPLADTLTVTRSTVKNLLPYYYPAPAPQAGGRATLDSGDSRVLKVVYRNGFLYTARDSGYTDATTTITFDLIDTSTMTATSQVRIVNANAFYPAFDVPASTASGAPFATDNIIYGTTTAADGSLTFAGISKLKAGEGYFDWAAGGTSRWGDWFGGAVDPVSGGLWAYGEYAKAAVVNNPAHWGTWAGYFPWSTAQAFSDVGPSSGFFDYVNVLSMWRITGGCATAPARFCPGDAVTRGQFAVFLIRAMFGDSFTYTTTPYFTDVASSDPFFPYIQKMRDLGITGGCSTGKYCPGDAVSRSTAAILVIRGKMGSLFGDKFPYPTTPSFTDVSAGSTEFPFIQKMFELGITAGCSATQFCPNDAISRQQAAVFLTRALLN